MFFARSQLRSRFTALVLLAFFAGSGAYGLILDGANAQQSSPPADDPGYANAVSVNGSSGVYLGNQWVLTANHVGSGTVVINNTSYSVQPGSAVQLRKTSDNSVVDLQMFRLASDPGLPTLTIASTQPAINTSVVLMGFGYLRNTTVSYDTSWVLNGTPTIYSGYSWSNLAGKNYGFNNVDQYTPITVSSVTTDAFSMDFDDLAASANQATGALYDSGGPVFYKTAGQWRLLGIMIAIARYPGQPQDVSLFGSLTWAANLTAYKTSIESLRSKSTPFEIWQYSNFRDASTDVPESDPDGDGLSNFHEYAYGLSPNTANPVSSAPTVSIETYATQQALTIVYTRNTLATDVTITVEVSSDLVNWSSGSSATSVVSTQNLGSAKEKIAVRDLTPISGAEKRFIRLRLTR